MSSGPNEPSSDLELARKLSARLSARAVGAAPIAVPTTRYMRFDIRRVAGAVDSTGFPSVPPAPLPRFGPETWNQLLDGCLAVADGESAFLMDGQGLVVACRGVIGASDAEAIGARLLLTLDQATAMGASGEPARSVIVEVEGRWLSGLRASSRSGMSLTVGVLGPSPLGAAAREVVDGLLSAAIEEE